MLFVYDGQPQIAEDHIVFDQGVGPDYYPDASVLEALVDFPSFGGLAAACEQDEVAKDFFLSSYRSELCMDLIRKNDKVRAKEVFKEYCSDWSDEYFAEAEALVSGIEYAVFFTTSDSVPLEIRVGGAIRTILSIYNVPKEIREQKIKKVLSMNYKALGMDTLRKFRAYVDQTTEQALFDLLKRKQAIS